MTTLLEALRRLLGGLLGEPRREPVPVRVRVDNRPR